MVMPRLFPRTWPTQVPVLLLLTGINLHAPGVVGEGEQVLDLGRGADGIVQPLQPVLALLKRGELTPGPDTNIPGVTFRKGRHSRR